MFKNPNFVDPASVRFNTYKPFIDEFIDGLPDDQQSFTFQDIREWAAVHDNPSIPPLVADMSDGLLEDLCQRAGIERE